MPKVHDTGVGPTAFENLSDHLCIYGECIVNGGDNLSLSKERGSFFAC